MIRSLSAGIFGACLLAGTGCTGPATQSRAQSLQVDPNTYIVQSGDTLESIAFRYKQTSSQIAALNPGLSNSLVQGQHVRVRSGNRDLNQANQTVVPANYRVPVDANQEIQQPTVSPQVVVTGVRQGGQVIREEIIEDNTAPVTVVQQPTVSSAPSASGGWRWPSVGEVVRDFAPGEVNGQGIDIAGVPGQDIFAVGDGTVIYAGRDLSNSGNLVIIRHPGDVLSTYSHTKDLYVAEDDIVQGGDHIASLGWNSNKESVLHFGIRKNGKPVNPAQFLPRK